MILEDDWFLIFHDNLQSNFGGVPEAEAPYDIA